MRLDQLPIAARLIRQAQEKGYIDTVPASTEAWPAWLSARAAIHSVTPMRACRAPCLGCRPVRAIRAIAGDDARARLALAAACSRHVAELAAGVCALVP